MVGPAGPSPFGGVKPEGTEDEDAEGNMPRRRTVDPESTGEEDVEGNRRSMTPEGTEDDDAEGHIKRR